MPRRASAKRYAQAVFETAFQRDVVDQWADDLRLVTGALENGEFRVFLEHAKVPLSRKIQAIEEVLPEVDPLIQNVLALLISRGLVDLVPEVEDGYQQLLNELRGREQVQVSSAVPLEDEETERVTRFLTTLINKEVILDTRVDSSIIGGLVIQVGYVLLDGSTRTRLEEMGRRLQSQANVSIG